ncbi:inositol monophosphatase family protein [Ectothiorhodospira lacustris]|uniref:inositol monophosphatase family protein n=1 Tax=Ectothiorhodospira lacustris TaxID=2899127 RepID=UPI001EE8EF83|nr:inositol monophosphatase family protein [Ectothiorhodospira lacustris]MCG5500743.1 inositol-phosphate phosphatase [Ectothiorhodospira lacustris]MCG5510879.1 inositol-phosphate phosphatase [Ectothiorhodospira lacustris]MCG5522575.1 inositol-phosphate phosphatase [Ectothiorhodospira lacustris]
MTPFLKTAIDAALSAQDVIQRYYRQDVVVEIKPDQTPVTVADLESEKAIKSIITAAFPDHGIYGEETGQERMDSDYLWLIDPIDGTKSFVRRYPFFSTQIALRRDGELVAGVSNAPEFEEMAYAETGEGAFLAGEAIRVSDIRTLEAATLSIGNVKTLAGGPGWQGLAQIVQQVNRTRGYGDFYHYHLLASGRIDLVVESDVNILDIAALAVIVREAGGIFTDLQGGPLTLETTSVLAAATPELHTEALALLNP